MNQSVSPLIDFPDACLFIESIFFLVFTSSAEPNMIFRINKYLKTNILK